MDAGRTDVVATTPLIVMMTALRLAGSTNLRAAK